MTSDATRDWRDPSWNEPSDTPWRRRLRRHQGWWRQHILGEAPGARTKGEPDRAVLSMLPIDADHRLNFISDESFAAATMALEDLKYRGGAGLIQEDRLWRNLLSSQPLAFNLFGHFRADPDALSPWVASISPNVDSVLRVELEWAPETGAIGSSAMDARITYQIHGGGRGFLAIEVKYAEDLKAAHRKPTHQKYKDSTDLDERWLAGSSVALDVTGLRQFWYNQVLAHGVADVEGVDEFFGVVVAMSGDESARDVTQRVRQQLAEQGLLRFVAIEEILESIEGHDEWKRDFVCRYVDLANSEVAPGAP